MKVRVPIKVSIPREGEFLIMQTIDCPRDGDSAELAREAEFMISFRVQTKITPEGRRALKRALRRARKR